LNVSFAATSFRLCCTTFRRSGGSPDFILIYHHTTDTAEKINYLKMAKILKLAYLSGYAFADETATPKFIESPGAPAGRAGTRFTASIAGLFFARTAARSSSRDAPDLRSELGACAQCIPTSKESIVFGLGRDRAIHRAIAVSRLEAITITATRAFQRAAALADAASFGVERAAALWPLADVSVMFQVIARRAVPVSRCGCASSFGRSFF